MVAVISVINGIFRKCVCTGTGVAKMRIIQL